MKVWPDYVFDRTKIKNDFQSVRLPGALTPAAEPVTNRETLDIGRSTSH
jgi:hypothetical protein